MVRRNKLGSVGDYLKDRLKKLRKNNRLLITLFFIFPMIISFVVAFFPNMLLNYIFLEDFMTVSSYLFTLSSLIIVFVLLNSFESSDYHRSDLNKDYLNSDGFKQLIEALDKIEECIKEEKTDGLYDSYRDIGHIKNNLMRENEDVYLKAYISQINKIYNLLSRFNFKRFNFKKSNFKWFNFKSSENHFDHLTSDVKEKIVEEVDDLSRELKRAYKNIEEGLFNAKRRS